jgi:hypothetical protein
MFPNKFAILASILGVFLFTTPETQYSDLNDILYGVFYSGEMISKTNAPSQIFDQIHPQGCVITIAGKGLNRGIQICISLLGLAVRGNLDPWSNWRYIMFS